MQAIDRAYSLCLERADPADVEASLNTKQHPADPEEYEKFEHSFWATYIQKRGMYNLYYHKYKYIAHYLIGLC